MRAAAASGGGGGFDNNAVLEQATSCGGGGGGGGPLLPVVMMSTTLTSFAPVPCPGATAAAHWRGEGGGLLGGKNAVMRLVKRVCGRTSGMLVMIGLVCCDIRTLLR